MWVLKKLALSSSSCVKNGRERAAISFFVGIWILELLDGVGLSCWKQVSLKTLSECKEKAQFPDKLKGTPDAGSRGLSIACACCALFFSCTLSVFLVFLRATTCPGFYFCRVRVVHFRCKYWHLRGSASMNSSVATFCVSVGELHGLIIIKGSPIVGRCAGSCFRSKRQSCYVLWKEQYLMRHWLIWAMSCSQFK